MVSRVVLAIKDAAVSSGGGALAAVVHKGVLPATAGKLMKLGAGILPALALAFIGMPNLAAGYNGGMTALAFQNGLLADGEFADDNSLADKPLFLDADGQPMVLEEGEGYRYLTDGELEELERAGIVELE